MDYLDFRVELDVFFHIERIYLVALEVGKSLNLFRNLVGEIVDGLRNC